MRQPSLGCEPRPRPVFALGGFLARRDEPRQRLQCALQRVHVGGAARVAARPRRVARLLSAALLGLFALLLALLANLLGALILGLALLILGLAVFLNHLGRLIARWPRRRRLAASPIARARNSCRLDDFTSRAIGSAIVLALFALAGLLVARSGVAIAVFL